MKTFDEQMARSFLGKLFKINDAVEIRLLKNPHHKNSKFRFNNSFIIDNVESGIAILKLNSGNRNCYFGINKLKLSVLKFEKIMNHEYSSEAISEEHIDSLSYFMIDFDTVKEVPKAMSTEAERARARPLVESLKKFLAEAGIISYFEIQSGNGTQILIRTPDYANTDISKLKQLTEHLVSEFTDVQVATIDTTVIKHSQVARMPGTLNIRGTGHPERPYRLATFEDIDLPAVNDVISIFEKFIGNHGHFTQVSKRKPTDSTQPEPIVELFQEAKMYRSHLKGNIHRVDCLYKNLHSSEDPSSSETVLFINEGAKPQVNCHHHSCKEKDSSIEAYIEKFDELGLNTLNFKNQWSDKRCFPGSNILVPKLPLKFDSKGNVKAPKVDFVANYIHSLAGIDLKRWFGDLFVWNGSFWKHVDDPLNIFDFFHWVSSGLYSQGVATSVYQTLLGKVQKFEISPWEQNTKKLAVGNGDISLVLKGDKWIAELRPHDRKNNLIGKIEYDYVVGEKNVDFMELLTKLLGPVELDSRVKAISEMYGLMIFPVVPKIFNLIGPPGSGKSTLGKFGVKLLSENTRSGVDPSLFCKFNMESMIGKRANICLDVDFTKPIEDANIKKIEDDEPISIDRKFKPAILARLPLFHLFCSNDLLTCHDRGTGAQGRRWTLIKIDSQRFNESNQNRNIVNEIFLTNPSGILNFAIEGAVGILNRNRQTTVPTSSKVLMDKWLMSSNPIAQYVVEIRNDENTFIKLDPTGEIYRTELWINFVEWYEKSFNRKPFITASKFYDRIHESFMETKKNGDRYIIGFRNRSIHEPANPNTLQGVKMNRGF